LIGHSSVLSGIGIRTQNSQDQGGSMIMFAVGVLSTVVLLVGFGFVSTASAGWFFKYQKQHDTLPSPDENN
jgi:hypothetical protein